MRSRKAFLYYSCRRLDRLAGWTGSLLAAGWLAGWLLAAAGRLALWRLARVAGGVLGAAEDVVGG